MNNIFVDLEVFAANGDKSLLNAGYKLPPVSLLDEPKKTKNVHDEATVKTFYKENGHFRLQPENETYEPIIVNEVIILGKVIASYRYY